jgi:ATP-dependent phosphoenolpyruvate carboxykinase
MLIRPTKEERANFGEPKFVIINAGAFPANKLTTGMGSTTSVDLNIESKELVILGTSGVLFAGILVGPSAKMSIITRSNS